MFKFKKLFEMPTFDITLNDDNVQDKVKSYQDNVRKFILRIVLLVVIVLVILSAVTWGVVYILRNNNIELANDDSPIERRENSVSSNSNSENWRAEAREILNRRENGETITEEATNETEKKYCSFPNCDNEILYYNDIYCFEHRCNVYGCLLPVISTKGHTCINHTCIYPNCTSAKAYNSDYCYIHKNK